MKKTFFKLPEQKQQALLTATIEEFSQNSYETASINKIIKIAGISKGGLFKYIDNKLDLYLYTIENVLEEVIQFQSHNIDYASTCYFERLKSLIIAGFDFYKSNPQKYRMAHKAYTDFSSPCYNEAMIIRSKLIKDYQSKLLENIDWDMYNFNKGEILKVSKYLIDGYNFKFISDMRTINDIEEFEIQTMKELDLIFLALQTGMTKEGTND